VVFEQEAQRRADPRCWHHPKRGARARLAPSTFNRRHALGWTMLGLGLLILLVTSKLLAATLEVQVSDPAGAPIADAVISATPTSGKLPGRTPQSAIIDQIPRRFVPLVSVIQTGTSVTFPNKDNIEHDVYSFSPAKTFELNLYSGIAAHPVVFDKPGLVVLGCNIHDQMIAYVAVVDTPYFAKSDAAGHARLDGLPADNYDVIAWHYRIADDKSVTHQTVRVDTATPLRFALALKEAE
jgi:plastocyanin